MSFHALQVSFVENFYAFAEKPDKIFSTRLTEKTFAFVVEWTAHLHSREISCGHRPKFLIVSAGLGNRTLRERIRWLYNNVIYRLFEVISHLTKDRRVQTLRLDTNQIALIWGPTVHSACSLASRHRKIWREHCGCFGTQRLAKFCFVETSCV